jgi:dynein heavy chain
MLFVSGHINYGGRVTDDWDRRCLITLLKRFYTPEISNEKYRFSDASLYVIPQLSNDIEKYRSHLEQLPLHEDPAVFGLHENANITYHS